MEINKVYQGNCLEELKKIPDNSIDIIITSPPYNLGNKHHTGNKYHSAYNDDLTEEEYQKQQIEVLNECFRVLKEDGSMWYNHKNRIKSGIQISPYEWLLKSKFIIKQEIVWINRSQNFDKIRFYPWTERLYWLVKNPKTKMFNAINHYDVFDYNEWKPVGTSGKHTRAFPEKMVEDILVCFPKAKVVLDPYAGSGTTLLVAQRLERDYIGIELSEEFISLINQRVGSNLLGFIHTQTSEDVCPTGHLIANKEEITK